MDTQFEASPSTNAKSLLLPYALSLIIAMICIQLLIALTGGEVTIAAGTLTALVAVGIVVWLWLNRQALLHVRFGKVIAHTIAFVTVTTSFNVHALIRTLSLGGGENGLQTVAHDLLATPWFGATLVMTSAWGLGLLIHLLGAVLGRGWED